MKKSSEGRFPPSMDNPTINVTALVELQANKKQSGFTQKSCETQRWGKIQHCSLSKLRHASLSTRLLAMDILRGIFVEIIYQIKSLIIHWQDVPDSCSVCHMGNPQDKYDKQLATLKIKMRLKGHVENPQQFCILCYFYLSPRAVEWAARADQMKFFLLFKCISF